MSWRQAPKAPQHSSVPLRVTEVVCNPRYIARSINLPAKHKAQFTARPLQPAPAQNASSSRNAEASEYSFSQSTNKDKARKSPPHAPYHKSKLQKRSVGKSLQVQKEHLAFQNKKPNKSQWQSKSREGGSRAAEKAVLPSRPMAQPQMNNPAPRARGRSLTPRNRCQP